MPSPRTKTQNKNTIWSTNLPFQSNVNCFTHNILPLIISSFEPELLKPQIASKAVSNYLFRFQCISFCFAWENLTTKHIHDLKFLFWWGNFVFLCDTLRLVLVWEENRDFLIRNSIEGKIANFLVRARPPVINGKVQRGSSWPCRLL